ncbi:MAG: sulfatase-like hydrolase/transferase [Chitinivibrionales bacterium]|nr:sulfatase-like hydrolase/transferase [Chitinivibrionales bacterium]
MVDKPNILFILIDDMGWADIGCYGSSFYETPNLDRLSREGMLFTDAYASCPVCSPTRASILTGKYPATVGVTQFIGGHTVGRLCDVPYHHCLPMQEISLAAALRSGGYQTWHVGKWHLGGRLTWPDRHGFDVNIGGCDWGLPHHGYFSPWHMPTLDDGPEGEYLTDRLTDEAIRLIEKREKTRPFFLNLWHYAVHTPIQSPQALIDKYTAKARDLGLDKAPTFEDGNLFPCQHKMEQRIRRRLVQSDPAYAAMVENLDTNVGRVLDCLADEGLADNTIVVFTSDNGGLSTAEGAPTTNAPLAEGKGWMYEGGTREPLLVRWPAVVAPGSRCEVPTTSPDFYPTFLEAAGLPLLPEQHCDGVSILPLLHGESSLPRDAIFCHYPHYSNQGGTPGCSVRMGDYKLIEFFEDGALELYNLRTDIAEEHNLAEQEPERADSMRERLRLWRQRVGALMPRPNANWHGA